MAGLQISSQQTKIGRRILPFFSRKPAHVITAYVLRYSSLYLLVRKTTHHQPVSKSFRKMLYERFAPEEGSLLEYFFCRYKSNGKWFEQFMAIWALLYELEFRVPLASDERTAKFVHRVRGVYTFTAAPPPKKCDIRFRGRTQQRVNIYRSFERAYWGISGYVFQGKTKQSRVAGFRCSGALRLKSHFASSPILIPAIKNTTLTIKVEAH